MLPHQPVAARTSTSKSDDADVFNTRAAEGADSGEGGMRPAVRPGAGALEEAAMEARIEALEAKGEAAIAKATAIAAITEAQASIKLAEANAKAALVEAKAALAEKRLSAHSAAALR